MRYLKKTWKWFISLFFFGIVLAAGTQILPEKTLQEKFNQSPLNQKYTLEGNFFNMTGKDDPKDRIDVKIGSETEFEPKMKIERWDNEVNFSIKLIDNENGTPTINFDNNKIIWDKGNKKVNFYDIPIITNNPEGGYEFEVILKEKPISNKIEFVLETKGVDFFYQPELTQREKDRGAIRPENVIGSYAVYASENKINYVGGKEYKAGKIGHIFRPYIEDSEGNWTWGELRIENGILSVTIPQEFLNNAIYPIRHATGLTFGFSGVGGTKIDMASIAQFYGSKFTGVAGTLNSISAWVADNQTINATPPSFSDMGADVPNWEAGIYVNSTNAKLGISSTVNTSGSETTEFQLIDFGTEPTISAVDYYLYFACEDNSYQSYIFGAYDSGATGRVVYVSGPPPFGSWPDTIATSDVTDEGDYKFSIYATYTAGGAPSGGGKLIDEDVMIIE